MALLRDSSRWRVVEVPAGARQAYVALLQLADDSAQEIARYHDEGVLFGLVDAETLTPRGEVLVVTADAAAMELRSVAIDPAWQGRGLGRSLVLEVLARLRARGVRRVTVGTASASLDALRFYLRLDFRPWRVERDRFDVARGYAPDLCEDGIAVRDMIWLDRELE